MPRINQALLYSDGDLLHYKYMEGNDEVDRLVIKYFCSTDNYWDDYDYERSGYSSIEEMIIGKCDSILLGRLDAELLCPEK